MIAVRSTVLSESVDISGINTVEMVIVRCVFGKRITYFCCLYIPSGSCADIYVQ